MRSLGRFGLGLFGLVLVAGPSVKAQVPAAGHAQVGPTVAAPAAQHKHKGMFASRHCVECQRAYVKKHDGVDIPPPPSLPAGAMPSQVVHQHAQGAGCAACEAGGMPIGPVNIAGQYAPGHAVVGDPSGMPAADPVPVGMARNWAGIGGAPRVAASAPRPGSLDPTVMPTSLIPAQTGITGGAGGRPKVIGHLLGIGGVTRHARQVRADRKRESHAMIAYDDPSAPVSELPASVVYGKRK